MKPDFVDNRDGNTLQKALLDHLKTQRETGDGVDELWVASAYFNPAGLELLASETKHVGRIRLLLGADPTPESLRPKRRPGDPLEPEFTRREVRHALDKMDAGFRLERDLLPFERQTDLAIRHLLDFLRSGKIEVRRYAGHFLHAKAFIFRASNEGFIAGSSNLTGAGLRTNLELNLGQYENPVVDKVVAWYEELWEKAEPFDLAAIYEKLLVEYPPYLIYLKVLWHLYGAELEEEADPSGDIPVTNFQKHGVWRAQRILQEYGGVLVADGVGLGKTFIAGEIIRQYRDRRQRVLLVCPAALRDSTWDEFLNFYQLLVECVSFEQLANDIQLGGEVGHLKNPLDDYALVVIDEAQHYRNPNTQHRAAVLRKLLMGRRRDLLLLSATPVNNSLWDLYHLLHYFLKQDAHLADKGVLSIRERFEEAMREDPFSLNPDLLYPVIDATTVKRTRQFVKKHYERELIRGPDGKLVPIRFPKPVASSLNYDLEKALPGFLAKFEDALMPSVGSPLLTMARYEPENYPAGQEPSAEDTALVGLLRSGLLKRFESSAYAFSLTTARMAEAHQTFLDALDQGKVITKEFLREWSAADDETDFAELLGGSENVEDASPYNVAALRADVESDLKVLREFSEETGRVRREEDPKLAALVDELVAVVEQAKSQAIDGEEEQQFRKVLIFSFFEDTIDWIEEHLAAVIQSDPRLACFRGRMASVSGRDARGGISREAAIFGFAPVSSKARRGQDQDRFDLLLCTDVLAEGLNLQQCRNIINFELPWNPMRLVQRHGRIDRIGSPYKEAYLRTFFPDEQLNALLNLEERVRMKLAYAAASVGLETAPIERAATGGQTFAETKEEIEKLHKADPGIYEAGGTSSAAQTGEEYRQELREALKTRRMEIEELPWKAGSGMARGRRRGHFFCVSVGDRIYLRFVPFDGDDEEIVKELGTCLRIIECSEDTPRTMPTDLMEGAYDAWERAKASVFDAWNFETDPKNLQQKVRKLNRDVAEYLRRYPPPDAEEKQLDRCLEAVESRWSRREENMLRLAFNKEYDDPIERSRMLIEEIERIGVEPYQAPDPLPPIEPEEIHLICWMAIEAEA